MARRRYISTEISSDKKVNKMARQQDGDFYALLYTWMIPHAEDNCEITGDPEEILSIVIPGRRDKTEEDVIIAIKKMIEADLVIPFTRNEKPMLLFPPDKFYKFQSYISRENRNYQGVEGREKNKNAEKRREIPENTVSPSLSPSLSPSPLVEEEENPEGKVFKFYNQNIGMIVGYQAEVFSKHLEEGMKPDLIIAVMQNSLGKRDKWSWINKVLNNLSAENVKSLEQYETKKVEMQKSKSVKSNVPQRGNFQQRQYSDEYFDSLYENIEADKSKT